MHFELTQRLAAAVDDVAEAFVDPAYFERLAELPKLGGTEFLSADRSGDVVTQRVRYRFNGDLSPAVTAVIDPARLTWVEVSRHDLATHRTTFELKPDHYADRFSAKGSFRLEPADGGAATVRRAEGDVKVRALLVAGAVERAIISGLEEHLEAEAPLLEAFLRDR